MCRFVQNDRSLFLLAPDTGLKTKEPFGAGAEGRIVEDGDLARRHGTAETGAESGLAAPPKFIETT